MCFQIEVLSLLVWVQKIAKKMTNFLNEYYIHLKRLESHALKCAAYSSGWLFNRTSHPILCWENVHLWVLKHVSAGNLLYDSSCMLTGCLCSLVTFVYISGLKIIILSLFSWTGSKLKRIKSLIMLRFFTFLQSILLKNLLIQFQWTRGLM